MALQIRISLSKQTLELIDENGSCIRRYPVSTAANGAGERKMSFCTPRGKHIIRAKIGANCPENTIFIARRPSGEIFFPGLKAKFPQRDWILARILWLSGCEPGVNRLGGVDTMQRSIYIHGCPEGAITGVPESRGCIRMNNQDIIELFDLVPVYTPVEICEY